MGEEQLEEFALLKQPAIADGATPLLTRVVFRSLTDTVEIKESWSAFQADTASWPPARTLIPSAT